MFPVAGLMLILVALIFFVLVLILYIKWKRGKYGHIYCPKYSNFLLAHLLEIAKNGNQIFLQWANESDGTAIVLFSSWRVHIHFFDTDMIKEILGSSTLMKQSPSFFAEICGHLFLGERSLLTEPGTKLWANKRRKLDPFFHANGLKNSHSDMVDTAMGTVQNFLKDARENRSTDVSSEFKKGVAFVIAKVILNITERENFYHNVPKLIRVLDAVGVKARNKNSFWLPWKYTELKKVCKSDILELREYFKDHIMKADIVESSSLGQIIASNSVDEGLHLEDAVNDMMAFFFAGIETSIHTMNFALYEMLRNPDQFKEVETEVLDVYNGEKTITYEDLKQLKSLDNFIKETLRLHAVVSTASKVSGNKEISICGLKIPANSNIYVGIDSIQRLDKYWDKPLEFNMYRWRSPPIPFTYLPFSGGLRSCVGKQLALAEIKVFLSMLIRHCVFDKQEDLEIKTLYSLTNRLADNLVVKFYPRD